MLSDRLLQSALASTPIWSDGALEVVRHWVLPHLRRRQVCRRLTGVARDGSTARVLVVGSTSKLDHDTLGPGFFAEPPVVEELAPMTGHRLVPLLETELDRHDLVLARIWKVFAGDPKRSFITMPEQPDMRLPVGSREAMFARATPTMRREIRLSERHGFKMVRTTDDASFERFYWDYHVPFIRARHGDGAVVHTAGTLRRRLRRGGLTWAALAGEHLYAGAFEIMGNTVREFSVGSVNGRVNDVVRSAAYQVRVEHMRCAHAAGLRWLSMGGIAPWLSDGLVMHKRAWGGELIDRYTSHRALLVGWRRWTPAIARFLAAYPLIVRRPWGFGAVAAATGSAPADRAAALKRWRGLAPLGIRRLLVLADSGAEATVWSANQAISDGLRPDAASSAAVLDIIDHKAPSQAQST